MKISKRIPALIVLSVIGAFCICGCSDNNSSSVEDIIVDRIDSATAAMNATNASSVDIACKNYYASIMSGVETGKDLNTASIMDALKAAGSSDLASKLYIMSVDSSGTIFVTGDSKYTPDSDKTALLSTPNKKGSLAELYK